MQVNLNIVYNWHGATELCGSERKSSTCSDGCSTRYESWRINAIERKEDNATLRTRGCNHREAGHLDLPLHCGDFRF